MINKKLFNQANLDGSNRLIYNHNLNTQDIIPSLSDDNGVILLTADNFWFGDASKANKDNYCTVLLGGAITGTYKLLLSYETPGSTGTGIKPFETTLEDPTDDDRLIFAKPATPIRSQTFTGMVAYFFGKLAFAKRANNLSDLQDMATARSNLGVYSTVAVDTAVNAKASLYQAASGAALGINNSAVFNPTSDYNPATKKYADENGGGVILKGITNTFDVGDGNIIYRITLPATLTNNNYVPVVHPIGYKASNKWEDNSVCTPIMTSLTTTYFDVIVYAIQNSATQNIALYFEIKTKPSNLNCSIATV